MYYYDQNEPLGFLLAVQFPLFLFCVREVRRNYYPKQGCGPDVVTPVARHVTILLPGSTSINPVDLVYYP
jgi:hypothetical protein